MIKDKSQRLFFIEICVAALYLLMVAVVCFMGFTKAKILQVNATNTTEYVNVAENAAETFMSSVDKQDALSAFEQEFNATIQDNGLIIYQTEEETATVDIREHDGTMTAYITVKSNGKPVYQLTVLKALGENNEN